MTFKLIVFPVDNSWADFGQYVENLSIHMSVVPVYMFFRMLQHCVNLKRLELYAAGFLAGIADNSFKLDSVEEFSVHCLYHKKNWKRSSVIDLFGPIFPRLKTFSLFWVRHWSKGDKTNLFKFFHAVQGTLQTIKSDLQVNVPMELLKLDQLHLKQAEFFIDCSARYWDNALWLQFCKVQHTLEELVLMEGIVTNEALCIAAKNLPNLKKLSVNLSVSTQVVPTFLSHLIKAEYVQMQAGEGALDFRIELSPALKELHLECAEIPSGIETLMTSPYLEKLTLKNVYVGCCPIPTRVKNCSSLKQLELNKCGLDDKMLDYMLRCHPSLETIRLQNMFYIAEDAISKLLKHSPNLNEVILFKCYSYVVTEQGVMHRYSSECGVPEGSRDVKFVIEEITEDDDEYYY